MNILITAALSAQAYRLSRFLDSDNNIFLGDSGDLPLIGFIGKSFIKIPDADSASFSHLLLAQCLDLNIRIVYPLKRAEVLSLSEARLLFDEYGIKIMVPDRLSAEKLIPEKLDNGELIIKDEASENPDRGIFIIDTKTNTLKLFTAD